MPGRSKGRFLTALRQPIGLAVVASSVALVLAAELGAPLADHWTGREGWLLGWGAVSYLALAVVGYVRTAGQRDAPAPSPRPAVHPVTQKLVEDALKHLHEPAKLAESQIISTLPLTIRAAATHAGLSPKTGLTPLQRSDTLKALLIAFIEKLRQSVPDHSQKDARTIQHVILYEEYVVGRPNVQIMMRYEIPEKTFYNHRHKAVSLLTAELAEYESQLQRSVTTPGPRPAD